MQIQPETFFAHSSHATAKPAARSAVFQLVKMNGDRINGSMPVWSKPQTAQSEIEAQLAAVTQNQAPDYAASLAPTDETVKDDKGYGFFDLIDIINPLQHIPVLGHVYRSITGDMIKPASRIVGGAAFGGPIGAAAGFVNAMFQMETGKDVGENMVASLDQDTTIAVSNLRHPSANRSYNS